MCLASEQRYWWRGKAAVDLGKTKLSPVIRQRRLRCLEDSVNWRNHVVFPLCFFSCFCPREQQSPFQLRACVTSSRHSTLLPAISLTPESPLPRLLLSSNTTHKHSDPTLSRRTYHERKSKPYQGFQQPEVLPRVTSSPANVFESLLPSATSAFDAVPKLQISLCALRARYCSRSAL